MPDAESVVLALAARREGREALVLLDGVQTVAPSREHLVRVGLVADVPDQPVIGGVENVMQGDGQLDGAQPGGEMAAARADALDQELAQLVRQLRSASLSAAGAGPPAIDRLEQWIGVRMAGSFGPVYTAPTRRGQ